MEKYMIDTSIGRIVKIIEWESTALPDRGFALVERIALRDGAFYMENGKVKTEQVLVKQTDLK